MITIFGIRIKPELARPLCVTIVLIAVYRLGYLVPIPFLDSEGIKGLFNDSLPYYSMNGHFSIFMLGVIPYISAYILIEILSLFIPILKKLRFKELEGRKKLKRISLILSLVFAVYQADSIISGLQAWKFSGDNSVLTISTFIEHLILVCVLVGSFSLLLAICELISKFGIGHGISIILLSGVCGKFVGRFHIFVDQFEYNDFSSYLFALFMLCVIISFTLVLLRTKISIPCYHEKDKTTVEYFQLNLSPSSMAAIAYSASISMLPVTLSNFTGIQNSLVDTLKPGSFWYNMISCICVFAFSYLFGWAFLHPNKRVAKMQARGWHIADVGTTAGAFLLKKQFIYNLPWTIFLCFLVVAPNLLITGANVPFYLGGSTIPIVVAISLDLINGFNFYQNGIHRPVRIAEFHDIYDAGMVQNHLNALGIKSYLRGYHHRLLCYF